MTLDAVFVAVSVAMCVADLRSVSFVGRELERLLLALFVED